MDLQRIISELNSAFPFFKRDVTKSRISLKNLHLLYTLFFFALAIPSGIISYTAYEKLRLEKVYEFQQAAHLITQEIKSALSEAIVKEEERLDTEYSFLVVEGESSAKFLQRSILSRYPTESNFPGIVGYFQVDSNKRFSSPLLPNGKLSIKNSYGLSKLDVQLREQQEKKLYSILADNQLVVKNSFLGVNIRTDLTPNNTNAFSAGTKAATSTRSDIKQIADVGFDQLESSVAQEEVAKELGKKKGYQYKKPLNNTSISPVLEKKPRKATLPSQPKRKEKSYIPRQDVLLKKQDTSNAPSNNEEGASQLIKPRNFSVFESELDPFRFSILKSGHFVVYRKVWRDGNQLIQGAVLSIDEFFEDAIKPYFTRSHISKYSQLSIAYGKGTLANYPEQNVSTNNNGFFDEELYSSTFLSEPFEQLSLTFYTKNIPTNQSGNFILLITVVLVLSLIFGTYALFRLAYRQSKLAQQHQDFVSSVSHELKTPITSIQMYGEILKEGWLDDIKREEYYDFICSESERLSRLISNILQISKVSRNSLNLEINEIKISELANIIHSKVESQIKLSGFTYNLLMAPEIEQKKVNLASDSFIQIIINLVDNSIKYSKCSLQKQIDIKFDVLPNQEVSISVRDYGIGISKKDSKKVFELFYRVGNELTRKSKGTGIGLALVKELTNSMGGKVIVVNHRIGTEFKLTFKGI